MKCEFCPAHFNNSVDLRNHVVTAHPSMASFEWKVQVLGEERARVLQAEIDQQIDNERNSKRLETRKRLLDTASALARADVHQGTQAVL